MTISVYVIITVTMKPPPCVLTAEVVTIISEYCVPVVMRVFFFLTYC